MRFTSSCVVSLILCAAISMTAQDSDKSVYVASGTSKFVNFPGVPECFMGSVQQGDPSKGDAVLLLKGKTGCVIPRHWHTDIERLMMVSGRAKVEMKDGSPATVVRPGDFVNLDSKHVHQFTCQLTCMLFDVSTGAPFDIHYVDATGSEIPPDQALKAKASAAKTQKSKAQ
jgi:quercetin dioxygenase-like cupin family protein